MQTSKCKLKGKPIMTQKSTKLNAARVMVSARESRRYTGLGLPRTYQLIKQGVIPAINAGNRWLIPLAALEEALTKIALAESAARERQSA
jgi:excisionase family DNA binding protein